MPMDSAYDSQKAAAQLELLALERQDSPHSGLQMSRIASVAARYEVAPDGGVWRLIHRSVGDGAAEEVIALFQGVIYKQDLPPFTEKLSAKQARFLRQGLSITGLQTSTFDKIVQTVAEIHAVFGRAVGFDKLEECCIITSYDNTPAIELSNCIFTPSKGILEQDKLALSPDIDPYGYLTRAAGPELCYTEENVVAYYERQGTARNDYKYISAKPLIFSVGNIVEVQASFMVLPLKEKKLKSRMVLRGLTLIDRTFTEQAIIQHSTMALLKPVKPTLKRRVGYLDEEVSVTKAKMSRMDIDIASVEREEENVFEN